MEKKPKYTFSLTIETYETESGTREVLIDLMKAERDELIEERVKFVEFEFQIRDYEQYTQEEIQDIKKKLDEYKEKNYDFLSDFAPMQRY